MRKSLAIILILMGTACLFMAPASANHTGQKYTICHRTNSDTNPYVVITPDEAAVDGAAPGKGDHFLEHVGPVWNDTLKKAKIEWGDIIPPVPGHHEGLNWTVEGQAIYNNGCAPTVVTTTTSSTSTTSTTEPTTTTTVPETTTTTAPTTTTTVPGSTSTTVPETTTTVPELTTTTKAPELIPPVVISNDSSRRGESLPVTGSGSAALTLLGLGMILSGGLLAVRYRMTT